LLCGTNQGVEQEILAGVVGLSCLGVSLENVVVLHSVNTNCLVVVFGFNLWKRIKPLPPLGVRGFFKTKKCGETMITTYKLWRKDKNGDIKLVASALTLDDVEYMAAEIEGDNKLADFAITEYTRRPLSAYLKEKPEDN
jgi:hypothetical protein